MDLFSSERECHTNTLFSKFMFFFSGDCGTVKLLLAKGAYIDPVAFCGTPLHCAATHGHDGIMQILLDHNADVSLLVHMFLPLVAY